MTAIAACVIAVVAIAASAFGALVRSAGERRPVPGAVTRQITSEPVVTPTTRPRVALGVPLPPTAKLVPTGALDAIRPLPHHGERNGVAVYGDSLTLQAWGYIDAIARDRSQPLVGGAYGGTALCDWLAQIDDVLQHERLGNVVVAFVGNHLTPCTHNATGDALVAEYTLDLETVIARARAVGTDVTIVGAPDMSTGEWAANAIRLRRAFAALAGPGVRYVDAAAALSPNGFTYTLPCLSYETAAIGCAPEGRIAVRSLDGMHLAPPRDGRSGYSSGAWRYAALLMSGVPPAS